MISLCRRTAVLRWVKFSFRNFSFPSWYFPSCQSAQFHCTSPAAVNSPCSGDPVEKCKAYDTGHHSRKRNRRIFSRCFISKTVIDEWVEPGGGDPRKTQHKKYYGNGCLKSGTVILQLQVVHAVLHTSSPFR